MLAEEIYNKYMSIELLERYKNLSDSFNSEETLDSWDKDVVLEILKEFTCRFKFNKKEGFFGLTEQIGDFDFKLNLALKYGMIEPIMWGKNICTEEQFGGALIRITKLIQITLGVEKVERIKYPKFNSYEELREIITIIYTLYIDFKNEFSNKNQEA